MLWALRVLTNAHVISFTDACRRRESARPSREQLQRGYEQEEDSRGHTRWEDARDASLNFPDLRLRKPTCGERGNSSP